MATFGPGPFDSDIAMDVLAQLRKTKVEKRLGFVSSKITRYLDEDTSPISVSADELASLVDALGSLDRVVHDLGVRSESGRYVMDDSSGPYAQSALAVAAALAISLEADMPTFGEKPILIPGDSAAVVGASCRALQKLSRDDASLDAWFDFPDGEALLDLRENIQEVLQVLDARR